MRRTGSRRVPLPLAAGLLLALPAVALGWWSGTPADDPRPQDADVRPRASEVGSDACADCHPDAFRRWRRSSHRFTIAESTPEAVEGRFAPISSADRPRVRGETWPRPSGGVGAATVGVELVRDGGRYWALFDDADAFIARNFEPTETGGYAFPLDYVQGKLFYQTFLTRLPNGEIYVTPLLWDIGEETWRLAGWRPWARDCASCHVTGLALQDDPAGSAGPAPYSEPTRYVARPVEWLEPHVGCEICHGPGSTHVRSPTADNIVNPADLSPRARIDLCGTCHGMAVANPQTYRIGDPVDPPMDNSEVPPGWRINAFWPTGQHKTYFTMYQGLLSSRHWQGQRLTCAPCHPAHELGTRFPLEDDGQCTLCHSAYSRRLPDHTNHPPESSGSRCVACHMPRNNRFTLVPGTVLMTHVHSHDFTIPDPRVNLEHGVPDACTQCHAGEGPRWALEQVRRLWGDEPDDDG